MRTAFVILALAGACGDSTTGDDEPEVNCAMEDKDEFIVGLQKTGTVHDVKLMSSLPAPPQMGDNDWIIHIDTLAGTPVSGATINVTPFMNKPQAHGTPVKVLVAAMPAAGDYQLSRVNLWMPGVWETTIEMSSASGTDEVVYRFCIPK
jgi:hypothetical protein